MTVTTIQPALPAVVEPIEQAAAIAWRGGRGTRPLEIAVVTARRGGWTIPKGHVERGHTLRVTAQRECYEEAGVIGIAAHRAIGSYIYLKAPLMPRRRVSVFELDVREVLHDWPEAGQRIRRWVSPEEAASMMHTRALADLLRGFRPA